MSLVPLVQVSAQVRTGTPLPWNVRDSQGGLLLSRGHVLDSDAMVEKLLDRGVFVDSDEIRKATQSAQELAPPQTFFERLAQLEGQLTFLLRDPAQPQFLKGIEDSTGTITKMAGQHTDPLIFSVIRPNTPKLAAYGITHSVHAAAVCALLARKLAMPASTTHSLVGAALTMNLSMIGLQGQLAARDGPLTADQKADVKAHPVTSVKMLERLGLKDKLWLQTIVEHHEQLDGKGYPGATNQPCETAQILRMTDIFTAKHSPRGNRAPLPAKAAAQLLYKESGGHPIASMLIKEFGVFPPGCFVTLANGETCVVVQRGQKATTPIVRVLMNHDGDPVLSRRLRDTSLPLYSIRDTVSDTTIRVPVIGESLYGQLDS